MLGSRVHDWKWGKSVPRVESLFSFNFHGCVIDCFSVFQICTPFSFLISFPVKSFSFAKQSSPMGEVKQGQTNVDAKVILLGMSDVGKTCLFQRFITNRFVADPSAVCISAFPPQNTINRREITQTKHRPSARHMAKSTSLSTAGRLPSGCGIPQALSGTSP